LKHERKFTRPGAFLAIVSFWPRCLEFAAFVLFQASGRGSNLFFPRIAKLKSFWFAEKEKSDWPLAGIGVECAELCAELPWHETI
jgi:hypothetical protein